jgi:mono/diheme cytochrome c family protein
MVTVMRSLVIAIPVARALALALGLGALTGACSKSSPPPPSAAQQEAQVMYDTKCAVCHGPGGAGNGPSADSFNPRPHDHTDPAWQASVTDDQIREIILKGGVHLGKSPGMPSHTLLRDRPEVLEGLVKIVRGFGKRP